VIFDYTEIRCRCKLSDKEMFTFSSFPYLEFKQIMFVWVLGVSDNDLVLNRILFNVRWELNEPIKIR
jgi:hypothetical protein